MKAIWNQQVIAESDDVVTVEGNIYFPMESLNRQHIVSSDHHTSCPWKGLASYFSLSVNGKINSDAAWYYPEPKAGAEQVQGRVAFWKGVEVRP